MTQNELPEIEAHCLTHIGKVREDNQDSVHIIDQHDELTASYGYLFGVADGMGGYAQGGVASSLALLTLFETVYSSNGLSTCAAAPTKNPAPAPARLPPQWNSGSGRFSIYRPPAMTQAPSSITKRGRG